MVVGGAVRGVLTARELVGRLVGGRAARVLDD